MPMGAEAPDTLEEVEIEEEVDMVEILPDM